MIRGPSVCAVALALVVILPAAALAADPADGVRQTGAWEIRSVLYGLWEGLVNLFAPSGSIMDPDGLAAPADCPSDALTDPGGCLHPQAAGSGSDSGSIMDPDG